MKLSEGRPVYNFYDGPPFATGTPHYGHILASTVKDIIPRYAHMTGHHVERRFGWDTHGLPVEYEIDKKLGITGKQDVMDMGIDKYNAECRAIVMRYASEWRSTIGRMGRWIDFDNDYKTLYPSFMETIWWVFKQLLTRTLFTEVTVSCLIPLVSPPLFQILRLSKTTRMFLILLSPLHFLLLTIPTLLLLLGLLRPGLFLLTWLFALTPTMSMSRFTMKRLARTTFFLRSF